MAETHIPSTSALAQQYWRPGLIHEVERQTPLMSLVSGDDGAAFYLIDDLTKERGDVVQVQFSPTDESDGKRDGDAIIGKGQKLRFFNDTLTIDLLGENFEIAGQMSQQRVSFDIKRAAYTKAAAWWKRRFETTICNQMCANTVQTDTRYTGLNSVSAIDSNHLVHAGSGNTTDQAVGGDTGATLTLNLIDDLVTRAMSKQYLTYPIAPAPDGYYHLVIHPVQWNQLRQNTTSGEWEDIQLRKLEGGQNWEDNFLFTGIVGGYNRTLIHVSDYVTRGVHSTTGAAVANSFRAFFVGQQAACMAFGEGYAAEGHLDWNEQVYDHKNWSLWVDSVFGFKRTEFNGETYGSMVLTTYSAV